MTLQIKKDGFVHNGKEYSFRQIQYTLYQPAVETLTLTMVAGDDYKVVRIRSVHTSALLLGYARWRNNQ